MSDYETLFRTYTSSVNGPDSSNYESLFRAYVPAEKQPQEEKSKPGSRFDVPDEMIAGVLRGAGTTTGQTIRGAGQLLEDAPGMIGAAIKLSPIAKFLPFIDSDIGELATKTWQETTRRPVVGLEQAGNIIQKSTEEALPIRPGMEDSFTRAIAEGVGSTIPSMAAFAAGGPAGIAAMGASQGYASTYDSAKKIALGYYRQNGKSEDYAQKKSEQDARNFARLSALVTGVTEPMGADVAAVNILRRADKATAGWLAKQIAHSATENALQEAIQEIPDETARLAYNRDRDLWDSAMAVGKAGLLGGTVGVIVSGIASAPSMLKASGRENVSPKSTGLTSVPASPEEAAKTAKELGGEAILPPVSRETTITDSQRAILDDHQRRTDAGQADPTPNQKTFTNAGYDTMTRKERAAEVRRIQEIANAEEVRSNQGQPGVEGNVAQEGEINRGGDVHQEGGQVEESPVGGGQATAQGIEDTSQTPAAEALQQQTKKPPGSLGAFAPGFKPTNQGNAVANYFPRQEIADEFERTRGIDTPSLLTKVKRWATKLGHVVGRPQEYLAQNEANASFNEFFRLLKVIPEAVRDESTRTIAAITGALEGKADQNAFSDYLIVQNQLAALDRGEPLRFPFESRAEVEQMDASLDAIVQQNPSIANAIQQRTKIVKELTGQLVAEGVLPQQALNNAETYFHQQVLMYAEAQRQFGGPAKPTIRKKGFQQERVRGDYLGKEYAYNKDYIESEFKWMTDAHALLRLRKLLRDYIEPADIKPQLAEQAKAIGGEKTWKDLIPEGYDVWQSRPGRSFFPAISIPEKVYQAILDGSVSEIDVDESTFKTVMALGQPFRQMVLPSDLVKQLQTIEKAAPQGGFVEGVDKMAVAAQKAWKAWVTGVSPKRFLSYNIRNAFGDGDVVIGGAPGTFVEIPGLTKKLWSYWNNEIAVDPEIKAMRDLGVLESGFAAQEAPSLKELPVFERFYEGNLSDIPSKLLRAYYNTLRKYTNFRESLMRASAFVRYKAMLKEGKLSNFGASNKKIIQRLMQSHGVDVAAAKLARDLVGDYGNRTVMGKFLASRLLPFWSFQEINMQRYPRMALNAATAGDIKTLAKLPVLAAYRMILLSRLAWVFSGMWLYNMLFHPDEERENERWIRQNPHLDLGRRPDGSIITFNNLGAFGELMEWFGINSILGLQDLVESGQMTTGQLIQEALKDHVNKLIQSIRPEFKVGAEMLSGQSSFPDVFSPRSVDPIDSFANTFGLVDEVRWARGKIEENGERPRPNYIARLLTIVTDPRQSALHEIADLRARFLETKGREQPPSYAGNPLMANMRQAAMNGDYEAFKEAQGRFRKAGKGWPDFKRSMAYLDPISNRLNDKMEREFVRDYLTPVQRERLDVARDYAAEIRDIMTKWWFNAEDKRKVK